MGSTDPIEEFRTTNGVAFPAWTRFAIEVITLAVMLTATYFGLKEQIGILNERMETVRAAQASMEKSVKDVLTDHDHRLDEIEQGKATAITDLKDQIKELKRSKQTKRGE
jgi:prefoldin subunit 5